MKKYAFLIFFSFALSTSLISCRETKEVIDETEDAVEEGVEEIDENTDFEDDGN